MSDGRVHKLEALLARVLRNRGAAPERSSAVGTAPLVVATPPTPRAPAVVASAPPASIEPPRIVPSARVEQPRVEPPPFLTPPASATPAPPVSVAPPVEAPPPVMTPSWQPEPGSAVQARPTSIPPMEISDDDLLEVSTLPPSPEAPTVELQADSAPAAADDEQPPASSRRFKLPDRHDDANSVETEREIPVKTPPPESGPQEALPATGLEAARMPDVSELEADLSGPPSMGPTAEQLGETIELEAPRGPELEIDVTVVMEDEGPDVPEPAEELEVALPRPSLQSGLYDVAVTALPRHAAMTVEAPPLLVPEMPTLRTRAAPEEGPERTLRAALGATDVAAVKLVTPAAAKTFVELLDASLGL